MVSVPCVYENSGVTWNVSAQSHRGQRLATCVLAALAQAAIGRGHPRVMLQVERANEPAQKLYARCGFTRAWTYRYWREAK